MPEVPVSVGQTGEGNLDESLPNLSRAAAGVGDGQVLGLSSMEGEVNYSITVFGLAADGSPEPSSPTSGTLEPTVVITPVGTPVPVCEWECILRTVGWPEYEIQNALSVSWCESRWQDVQNYNGGNFWGRLQISPYWHADKMIARGYPPVGEVLLDPWVNAEIGLMIWEKTGWTEWQCKP